VANLDSQPPGDPAGVLVGLLPQSDTVGLDGLHLAEVPFVPGVRLYLASDAIVLGARLQAQRGHGQAPPLWAEVWAGGHALARHIVSHPELVAGRSVLDVASGSGIVAIAAALAGASAVTANDIDPYALAVIGLNARCNAAQVAVVAGDLLDGDGSGWDVVLAGDVFYCEPMATRMLEFLRRAAARGAQVLVGDPGRACLPRDRFGVLASYPLPMPSASQDAQVSEVFVLQLSQ
jgi:predicted nicotinamide N-methyase